MSVVFLLFDNVPVLLLYSYIMYKPYTFSSDFILISVFLSNVTYVVSFPSIAFLFITFPLTSMFVEFVISLA